MMMSLRNLNLTSLKAYLEQLLTDKLYMCSLTARHEFGHEINFEELYVLHDCER